MALLRNILALPKRRRISSIFDKHRIQSVGRPVLSPAVDSSPLRFRRNGTCSWIVFGNAGAKQIQTVGPFNERHFEYLGVEEPECNPNENQPYQSGFRFIESAESDLVGLIDNGKYFPIALVTSENSIWVAAGRTCKGPVANNGSGDYTISLINTISLLEDLDVAVCVQVDVKAGAAADYEFTSICNIYKNRNGDLLQALAIKDANVHLLNLTENFGGQDVLPGDDFRVELVIQLSTRTTTLGAWFPVWVSASLGVAEQQG